MTRRMLVIIALASAACSDKPTAPSQPVFGPTTSSNVSALSITGPNAVAPGTQFQYQAIARYADGETEDVTTKASWASSKPQVLEVHPNGNARGEQRGGANLSAKFGGVEHTLAVRVLEPGTFVVSGTIVQAGDGRPIAGATVTVDSGIGMGRTTTTDGQGTFEFYGLSGSVQLTMSASGYQSRGVNITVTQDTTAHVLLNGIAGGLKDAFKLSVIGPERLAVGASGQYRAMLHYLDGSTEDVTTRATWSAENVFGPPTMTISPNGIAAGIADGPCSVRAILQQFEGSKVVAVLRTGTFTLVGAVSGSDGAFLHMATVTVESGIGAGKVAHNTEWDLGFALWGVAGPVRLRASFPGYQDSLVDLNVTRDMVHSFTLTPLSVSRHD